MNIHLKMITKRYKGGLGIHKLVTLQSYFSISFHEIIFSFFDAFISRFYGNGTGFFQQG